MGVSTCMLWGSEMNPDTHGENMQSPKGKQLAWRADSEPWERPSYEAAVITYNQAQIMFMEINGEKANPKWTILEMLLSNV